ncbi:peptide/nickel transport system permease protein [Mameliella alba]|uniref:ABC transporter permease n=1 Tax=Mameliella alba TaxID=561184 RepID=UPI0008873868|nr:ABC transporter permease [Mameliella alba]PTR39354.1 peptide/nickel transport system permease protein [Mameliella alba]GGF65249.1 ABC transporter permease [Mameliella alba]SDD31866.1 peptide/nickel transport system permease protein [Mameliella alba]
MADLSMTTETDTKTDTPPLPARRARLAAIRDSDLWYSFRTHPSAVFAACLLALVTLTALFAPWITPQDPYDLAALELWNSEIPPIWNEAGQWPYILGTDTQGRDILSAILYGSRISLIIGFASVIAALSVGLSLGLIAGYFGGWIDNVIMRLGDVLLSMPFILIAILITAVATASLPTGLKDILAAPILILAIAVPSWVQYARTVRASAMVERKKEYVQAARLIRVKPWRIMLHHILPNCLTPILVAATLNFGLAILSEATLSFLGVGMPPDQPSLGTLIRIGNQYLFSGLWWIVVFPAVQLCLIVLSVNMIGDWLRDALNPKLR